MKKLTQNLILIGLFLLVTLALPKQTSAYMASLEDPAVQPPGQVVDANLIGASIKSVSPTSLKLGRTFTIKAKYLGTSVPSGYKCYFYASNGKGTFFLHDAGEINSSLECSGEWTTTATGPKATTVGQHTVAVTVQKISGGDTPDSRSTLPTPNDRTLVNICDTDACGSTPVLNTTISPSTGIIGKTQFTIKVFIPDLSHPWVTGKKCSLFVSDGKGDYALKGTLELSACTSSGFTWTSDAASTKGNREIIVSLGTSPNVNSNPRVVKYIALTDESTDDDAGGKGGGPGTIQASNIQSLAGINITDLKTFMFKIISSWAPLYIGILAFVAFIYAGFMFMTDTGDGKGREKAKKTMIYSVAAMVIVALSWWIITFIIRIFNNNLSGSGLV